MSTTMVQSLDDTRRRNQSASSGRVPPYNLQAEESLLGAMLLSRDAIAAAVEACSADDFYKPAHGHIYEAVCSLYGQGEPADPVTVADELRRADLLDAIGGPATLISLQANTPATANAGRYARIVEEHALLRRLIGVANEIAELGYSVPEDVATVVDRAESMVFEVAERRVTDTLRPLHDLLSESLDRLEALYDRGEAITGVPTGYVDLDERLSGLQPSNLVIVGARPSMGKCATGDTRILNPFSGELESLKDLYQRGVSGGPVIVLCLGPDQWLRARPPSDFIDDGVKPVFKVRTRLGREVRATAGHPFLTPNGWQRLCELTPGIRLAVPRELPFFGNEELPEEEVALLASLIGDGSCSSTSAGFTNVISLLRRHGVWGKRSTEKCVPPAVFKLPEEQVALFLNRLFATDGTPWWTDSGRGYGRIAYGSASKDLIRDVQHLLLRFGINARIRPRSVLYNGGRRPAWELEIMAAPDIRRFCERIGIFSKEDACANLLAHIEDTGCGYTRETLPNEVWDAVLNVKGEERWAEVSSRADKPRHHNWHVGTRSPRRETVALLADALQSEELRFWPESDIYWDEIVSIIPDGEEQVYDLTIPDDHNFVANDMFVHNTSFGLGLASHASMEARLPVLYFSLEMSHSELTQRLLCSEARVDSSRIRNGRLLESDWPKISHAIGRLGEAPLYIDDNPNLTVMEIRAKARRLKSRLGELGVIVVDYLQLMSSRNNTENRQVEVSEISRGLKILARELEVPVVALSQLSRNLEMRADKRPVLADLRESGCMPASTTLMRADDGQEVTLGELVLTQQQPEVWSLDGNWRLVPRRLLRAFPSGIKPVYRMRLASGTEVDATANHRFLTKEGWTRLDRLAASDHHVAAAPAGEVFWDEIIEVTALGEMPTFDATVEDTHNFIANGVIAHNSLEQDADVVMFLYRDEVYNPESPDRGTAEVIVSKHRNGPTGITQLAFLDHYTRFANMARV